MIHPSVFEYLKPTDGQMKAMASVRAAFAECAAAVLELVPEGYDRGHVLRQLRDAAMWANVAITRNPDGSPRG